MKQNGRKHDSLTSLEQRAAEIRNWLGGQLDALNALKAERDAALSEKASEVQAAEQRRQELLDEQARIKAEAEATRTKGQALISAGEKLIKEANRAVEDAEAMDTGEAGVQAAKGHLHKVEIAWRDKLRSQQDGATRRKQTELVKLERRIEEKKRRAARAGEPVEPLDIGLGGGLPKDYGTAATNGAKSNGDA